MIVASRYAKSLLDLAVEKGQLEAVFNDMQMVKEVCDGSREFTSFLNSPIIKSDKKIEAIKAIFHGKLNAITSGFLSIVTSKRREAIIPEMAGSFIEQYRTHKNVLTAVITSAKGLDADTRQKALDLVKSQLNGEIELIEKTNPDLIGGFVLKIGDQQLDKSVARQLSNMKKELTNKALN
ncbi:MAG: synthase delta subunit [Bacteroidota bacterium]|jgi:F-type H+-transporting ATPase subunit delta|nr:synthase delta subunit [Bacteroidota bacterium]